MRPSTNHSVRHLIKDLFFLNEVFSVTSPKSTTRWGTLPISLCLSLPPEVSPRVLRSPFDADTGPTTSGRVVRVDVLPTGHRRVRQDMSTVPITVEDRGDDGKRVVKLTHRETCTFLSLDVHGN